MNCSQTENLLDAYIDGDLSPALSNAIKQHQQTCPDCAKNHEIAIQLQSVLREITVPPHTDDFVDRALKNAYQASGRKKINSYATFSGAIAAGLAVWLISAQLIFTTPNITNNSIDDVYVELSNTGTNTIKVAIESAQDLNGVQMSIKLTPNLELKGFGNRTTIDWNTQLKQGTNVIKLPIVGLASGEGEIITRIQMHDKEKIMHIKTRYQTPDKAWYQLNPIVRT